MKPQIGIIGAGSWGRALALLIAENGYSARLWSHQPPTAHFPLPITPRLEEVVSDATLVLCVVPSHAVRDIMEKAAPFLNPRATLLSCAKGIEVSTGLLMSQVLSEVLPQHPTSHRCFLSGPSFAEEVVQRQPTAVVITGTDHAMTQQVQKILRNHYFLPYLHDDVPGVEVGGAVKNVLAIAAGVVDGLGFGNNTRAALITRGLYEMTKIGKVYGAKPLTFSGLAGIGDLILTCTGALSRNRQVGIRLAKGQSLHDILANMTMVAEGIKTTEALQKVITHHGVMAPICTEVYQILAEGKPPRQAVYDILRLQIGDEQGSLR
jgi:glycerol-3-phosphate dehydrogenase (NAD(P)+)